MSLDLRQLRTFVTVAETGGLGPAAARLHLTQAALSLQLRGLQASLGVTLFDRTGRGLRPTEAGERLLEHARSTLGAALAMEQAASQLSPGVTAPAPGPALSFGTILDPAATRLGALLQAVSRRLPGWRPTLRHGTSGWVLREVRAGRLDAGLYLGRTDRLPVQACALAEVRYVVLGPAGWSQRLRGKTWAELAALPWIWTPPDSVHHRLLAPVFKQAGVRPQVVAEVDQEASMLDLVQTGLGLSLAREEVALRAAHEAGLTLSREHLQVTPLSLIAHRDRAAPAEIHALFDAAENVWADTAPQLRRPVHEA